MFYFLQCLEADISQVIYPQKIFAKSAATYFLPLTKMFIVPEA